MFCYWFPWKYILSFKCLLHKYDQILLSNFARSHLLVPSTTNTLGGKCVIFIKMLYSFILNIIIKVQRSREKSECVSWSNGNINMTNRRHLHFILVYVLHDDDDDVSVIRPVVRPTRSFRFLVVFVAKIGRCCRCDAIFSISTLARSVVFRVVRTFRIVEQSIFCAVN